MQGKNLLSIADLGPSGVRNLINKAVELKKGPRLPVLSGKVLALIFEKPSLRTRVSFDVAMHQLGGHTIYLSPAEVGLGKREPVRDVAGVLSRYVDGIVARTFSQDVQVELARWSSIPIINGLSDEEHPCQALGDFLTIFEKKGSLKGINLAYIGDGNNVANSLLLTAALAGVNFHIASPEGYNVPSGLRSKAENLAETSGARLEFGEDPVKAVADADIIYTDVWVSMGQEEEKEKRLAAFKKYQVNEKLLSASRKNPFVMHPMPVHHGEELESSLVYGPRSILLDQAENRLHIQKAVLFYFMGAAGSEAL